jgi:chromosome segregation ATPase
VDKEQIESKVDWLDKERKKEAEELQRIKTQINDLNISMGSFSKRLEELSTEISRVSTTASRIAHFDETLSKHRTEVSRQLEEAENLRSKKEKQLESLRTSDQKNIANTIDEIKRDLNKIDDLHQENEQRRAEDVRLNREVRELSESLDGMQSSISELNLRLVSVEEATSKEAERLSDVQVDNSALKRRADDLRNTIDSVEDRTRVLEVGLSELKVSDRERHDQLEVWMDEQRMKLVDFEKVWSNWTKRFDAFEAEAREIEEKIQAYDRTHRTIKQMQSQLEQLLERLERRITEVSEMQRLSDERMKQDWAAFEADETKKWSTFKLSSEERWKEHQRVHEKLSDVISELELLKTEIRTDLDELMERETQKVNQILELARQWIKDLK